MPPVTKQLPGGNPAQVLDAISRIRKIGYSPDDGIKIMIYGESATGKTTFWATAPGPILCLLCSGGKNSGELRSIDTPANRDKISSVNIHNTDELRDLIDYQKRTNAFKTIVLDHVSGLEDLTLTEVLGLQEIPVQKSWGLATQQQYGQCVTQCKTHLRAMLNLLCNVVFVAQERVDKNEKASDIISPKVGPGVMPSLALWLNPAVEYVVQSYKAPVEEVTKHTIGVGANSVTTELRERVPGKVQYRLRTGGHDVYYTKFRVPNGDTIPDSIVLNLKDPDYGWPTIIKMIQGASALVREQPKPAIKRVGLHPVPVQGKK